MGVIRSIVRAELAARPQSGLGRVTALHLPDAAGQNQYAVDLTLQGSDAVYEKVPLSTAYLGQLAPPVVGDVVVLAFVGGDPDQPIVTGFVFSEATKPPAVAAGEHLLRLPHDAAETAQIEMRTTAGENGSRVWSVTLPDGPTLTINDQSVVTEIGDFRLSLDAEGSTATLDAGGASLVLEGSGKATLKGDGDIAIESSGNLSLSAGGNAVIEASGTMALSASKIDLN